MLHGVPVMSIILFRHVCQIIMLGSKSIYQRSFVHMEMVKTATATCKNYGNEFNTDSNTKLSPWQVLINQANIKIE